MKKFFLYSAFALTTTIATTSCSDFLDQPVLGQENLDTYFKTKEECIKQVNGCYQTIFWEEWWKIEKMAVIFDMCTDDMWCNNTSQNADDWDDLPHFVGDKYTSSTHDYWQYRYKGVTRANIVFDGIQKSTILEDDLKKRLLAETRFIRAYQYFELAKTFGGLPIIDGLKMPSEVVNIKRSSIEDTYSLIESDLKYAIAGLPEKSEYATSDLGRATKGAAKAYLGKVYLYQEKYDEAQQILGEVISSAEYDLLPNFGDVWNVEHNNSIESIFEVQYSAITEYALGGRISTVTGSRDDSGWSWGGPTSNLENAFLAQEDNERLKWTIIKHEATEIPGEVAVDASKPYIISPDKHKAARISRKYYLPQAHRPEPYDGNHQPLNYRLMRYADVLLMYAEAQNAIGNDALAKAELNKVRARVSLDDVTSTGTELRDAIRLERRLELALEGQRLFDIRRWKEDDGRTVMAHLMGPNGSFVQYNTVTSTDIYETSNQKESSSKGASFREDRDLLFPIPMAEITLSNGSIVQNPGY